MVTVDKERIIAAVQVDHLYKAYEIEMGSEDALGFIEVAPLAGAPSISKMSSMIKAMNAAIPPINFGPDHPQTGKPHHSFSIGRHRGERIVNLSVSKMYFKPDYDFMGLVGEIQIYAQQAGADVAIDTDSNFYSVMMRWPVQKEVAV